MSLRSYRKPPVFDSVKKALDPRKNFTKALYGHGVGRNAGIFTKGAANPARRAQESDQEYKMRQAKIHALRGVVIGGNIVTLGLVNLVFFVQNAAHQQKVSKEQLKNEIQGSIRDCVKQSAPNFGMERFEKDLIQMVNYRFGFGPAPWIWNEGKKVARSGSAPSGIGSDRNAYEFYHGYIVFERHVAEVLSKFF